MSSRYRNDLTAERVRELLDYDPETGIFIWRIDRGMRARAGDRAGFIRQDGYICIKINGVAYQAHRLAFLWMSGSWPAEQIDHVNRVRHDNRWTNLREATPSENSINSLPRDRLLDLPRGVHTTRCGGKFRAHVAGIYIGTFDTAEEAGEAYAAAAHALYGEFYRGSPTEGVNEQCP
jgi:Demerecviridae HNH endonuclease